MPAYAIWRMACEARVFYGYCMSGIRDKNYWKLRNLSKQMSDFMSVQTEGFSHFTEVVPIINVTMATSLEYQELNREFDKLWGLYGFKSMVMNKRRRCSTRKSNQKDKRIKRRANKRHERQNTVQNSSLELTED